MEAPDHRVRRLTSRLLLLALLQANAASADLTFEPQLAVGVSYTDNIALAQFSPQKATIYQLLPGIRLLQRSKRFTTDLDSSVQAYRYSELGETDAYQKAAGRFVAALDPENFFFELGASRDQAIRTPDAPIPWTNLPISSNRVDRDDYYAGLNFDYPFGGSASAKGSVRRDRIRYDLAPTATFVNQYYTGALTFSLDNYRRERGFSWAAHYSADSTDFGRYEPWEYRQAGAEIGGWVSPRVRLFTGGGKESSWDNPLDPSLADSYWEVGVATRGQRVSLEMAAGDRTFGSSRRFSVNAELSGWRTGISYTEQPATVTRSLYRDLIASSIGQGSVFDFLTRPGAPERYISKLARWNTTVQLNRTQISAAVYDESREQRTLLSGAQLVDQSQSGLDVGARYRVGARTDLVVNVRRANLTLGVDDRRLRGWSAGAERRLGRRTSLSLNFTRTEEESTGLGTFLDYKADLVTVLLTRKFTG